MISQTIAATIFMIFSIAYIPPLLFFLPGDRGSLVLLSFFFNDTATTEIYTLSLHDALPIFIGRSDARPHSRSQRLQIHFGHRSEEHTSELQSHDNLVCRLLLEKKKNKR